MKFRVLKNKFLKRVPIGHRVVAFRNHFGLVNVDWRQLSTSSARGPLCHISLDHLVKQGDPFATAEEVPDVNDRELEAGLTYLLCNILCKAPSEITEEEREAQKDKWLGLLRGMYRLVSGPIDRYRPSCIVYGHGFEPRGYAMRLAAIKRDIPLLALENSALITRLVWENVSGIVVNRNLAHNYYWRYADQIDPVDSVRYCEEIILKTKQLKRQDHTSPEKAGDSGIKGERYVLFLGQVYTDASIVYGLGQWASPVEVVRMLIPQVKGHGFKLVVKLHPKEIKGLSPYGNVSLDHLTFRKLMADPAVAEAVADKSVLIDSENAYDTYDLINGATAAVTINSSSGLEAAIRRVPCVVCGKAYYDGLGFTFHAQDSDEMALALNAALQASDQLKEEKCTQARQFFHIFHDKYCIGKDPKELGELIARQFR